MLTRRRGTGNKGTRGMPKSEGYCLSAAAIERTHILYKAGIKLLESSRCPTRAHEWMHKALKVIHRNNDNNNNNYVKMLYNFIIISVIGTHFFFYT